MTVFPRCVWDSWTFSGEKIINHTYDDFLAAAAKFPMFCSESNSPLGYDVDDTCRREIATFFAHATVSSDDFTKVNMYDIEGEDLDAYSAAFDREESAILDGYDAMSSAMWKYMTTDLPNPSAHNIVTGFFVPDA